MKRSQPMVRTHERRYGSVSSQKVTRLHRGRWGGRAARKETVSLGRAYAVIIGATERRHARAADCTGRDVWQDGVRWLAPVFEQHVQPQDNRERVAQ
eukprot:338763-Prymnesium_polylepis.2